MATPFLSTCPECLTKLKLKNPEFIGKKVKCPKCSQPFVVEVAETDEVSAKPNPTSTKEPSATKGSAPPRPRTARVTQPPAADDDWLNDDLGDMGEALPPLPARSSASKKKPRKTSNSGRRGSRATSRMWPLILGTIVGCVAGAICTGIWIAIILSTGYEVGIVAWAVGAVVGFAVAIGSGEWLDELTGFIAAGISFISVAGWKILLFLLLSLDPESAIALSDFFSPYDALWIILAAATAYRVGSGQSGKG
ncbi:MAG: hypothetical protein KDA58_12560 [Planctomycetaceae bacterium]|nr:hypothetical protein [Planctomycetaceae bacterium]